LNTDTFLFTCWLPSSCHDDQDDDKNVHQWLIIKYTKEKTSMNQKHISRSKNNRLKREKINSMKRSRNICEIDRKLSSMMRLDTRKEMEKNNARTNNRI